MNRRRAGIATGLGLVLALTVASFAGFGQADVVHRAPITSGDTVFLGDSITEFGHWQELFPDSSVNNRGVQAEVTADVLGRVAEVHDAQPTQVFLLIGTNDLTVGVAESEIVRNVRSIIEEIHINSPNTELYVQSVLPRALAYRERVESLNRRLQPAIEDVATWIDLYPIFLDVDGSIKDDFSDDELHLLDPGYEAWRIAIEPFVRRTN